MYRKIPNEGHKCRHRFLSLVALLCQELGEFESLTPRICRRGFWAKARLSLTQLYSSSSLRLDDAFWVANSMARVIGF